MEIFFKPIPKFALLLLVTGSPFAYSHELSDVKISATYVSGADIDVQWITDLKDLDFLAGLDTNKDIVISAAELKAQESVIFHEVDKSFAVASDQGACRQSKHKVVIGNSPKSALLTFQLNCPNSSLEKIVVAYNFMFTVDDQHRGIFSLIGLGSTQSTIFHSDYRRREFSLGSVSSWGSLIAFVEEGILHIWGGVDHMLFLLVLLLPSVLFRRENSWLGLDSFVSALKEVAKIVTSFTIAHSITLTLVTLDYVALPSRLVESIIAASVLIAALNNLWPFFKGRVWMIAFAFGLIHGFGFASALSELTIPKNALVSSLFGFNLGVETGQLIFVIVALPVLFRIRNLRLYKNYLFPVASSAIGIVACLWIVDRVGDFGFMPF